MIKATIPELAELLDLTPFQVHLLEMFQQKQISEKEYKKLLKDNPVTGTFFGVKIRKNVKDSIEKLIDFI